jgi:hypothetical protein
MKKWMTKTWLYRKYARWQRDAREREAVSDWSTAGRPVPPPSLVKQSIVRHYAKRFALGTLVETGTYLGDMIDATQHDFAAIYSIELDRALHDRAKLRFAGHKHIHLVHGDSGAVLPGVLDAIHEPALFWLDGHWSGGFTAKGERETPIIAECEAVLRHHVKGHVILIDDARCFTGENDYPTITEMRKLFTSNSRTQCEVDADVIRIHEQAA